MMASLAGLAQDVELQVPFGGAVVFIQPQGPVHARQRRQQGAVDELGHVGEMTQAGVPPIDRRLLGEIEEYLLEQLRIEDRLGFPRAAQTHRTGADILLHTPDVARGAKSPHAVEDRIAQPEENEAEIILLQQLAFRIRRDTGGSHPGLNLSQTTAEPVQELPIGKLLGIDRFLLAAHSRSQSQPT